MSYLDKKEEERLRNFGTNVRRNIVKMIAAGGAGHPGGSLSCADIIAVLFGKVMRFSVDNLDAEDRDRFILSKGHASPALYAALAEIGCFPEEELLTFDQVDSCFQGHPCMRKTRGVDMSTGSLGQGLSVGVGMALAAKKLNKDSRIWVLLGDGELQEGQIWEAAMAAARFALDNLTVFVDLNGLQLVGYVRDTMPQEPLDAKWKAFGWNVLNIDGHDYNQIYAATREAAAHKNAPTVIIAHTIKGKSVSFMEDSPGWHARGISAEELEQALAEIDGVKGGEARG